LQPSPWASWYGSTINKGEKKMRFWDNDFDRKFDEAIDELMRQERQEYTEQELDDMYQEHLHKINIGNPMKLYGAI